MSKNNDLAFDLILKTLTEYAEKCTKDKGKDVMNPIEGTYLLATNLSMGLLMKAEDHFEDCKELLHMAIEDAYKQVKENQ